MGYNKVVLSTFWIHNSAHKTTETGLTTIGVKLIWKMISLENLFVLILKLLNLLIDILLNLPISCFGLKTSTLETVLERELYFSFLELHLWEIELEGVDCVVEVHTSKGSVVVVQTGNRIVDVPVPFLN